MQFPKRKHLVCAGTLVALEASVQRCCVKLAASGQKGTRMDYIFRPDSANKH